jgi:DNA end-binding protein Ku
LKASSRGNEADVTALSPCTQGFDMAARPSWEGHLRLSLVTCPVALYPATSEAETVRFNLINPETNNRIKMKTVDAGTGAEV